MLRLILRYALLNLGRVYGGVTRFIFLSCTRSLMTSLYFSYQSSKAPMKLSLSVLVIILCLSGLVTLAMPLSQNLASNIGELSAFDGTGTSRPKFLPQIRNALGSSNMKLLSVLSSDANPILNFLDEVIGSTPEPTSMTDKKSYETMLILKDCDYDLEKVEAKMRQFYTSRGTNLNRINLKIG